MHLPISLFGSVALLLSLRGVTPVITDQAVDPAACALVTRAEAASAAGGPVPAGAATAMKFPMQGASIEAQYCLYGSDVAVGRLKMGSDAQSIFAKYRQSLQSKSDYQDVSGVGDEAFIAKGQLAARKGTTGLIIDVGQARGGGSKEVQAEKALAVLAISRM